MLCFSTSLKIIDKHIDKHIGSKNFNAYSQNDQKLTKESRKFHQPQVQ